MIFFFLYVLFHIFTLSNLPIQIYKYNSILIFVKFHENYSDILDILIPEYSGQNKYFKYSNLIPKTNQCIQREKASHELKRIFGKQFSLKTITMPYILIVGSSTVLGTALCQLLQKKGEKIINVGTINEIDFSSREAEKLFDDITIKEAYITYFPPLIQFTKTDGSKYIQKIINNYLDGLLHFLMKKNIPSIFASSTIFYKSTYSILKNSNYSFIQTPYIIDINAKNDLTNPTIRTVQECYKVGYSLIQYSYHSSYQSILADQAAHFIIEELHKKRKRHILLQGYSQSSVPFAIHYALSASGIQNCSLHFLNFSHTIEKIQPDEIIYIGSKKKSVQNLITEKYQLFQNQNFKKLYLSIIVTGRHDNYSSGFESRIQNFLNSLDYSAKIIPLAQFEVIIVDYATPKTNSPLSKELKIGKYLKAKVRFINVSPDIHTQICKQFNKSSPYFEYMAKNIGIRRAYGKYILITNPDNLFSTDFFELIAKQELNPFIVYRSQLWYTDKNTFLNSNFTVNRLIKYMSEPWILSNFHISPVCHPENQRFAIINSCDGMYKKLIHRCGTGDFILLSKKMWHFLKGFNEVPANPDVDTVFNARIMKLIPGYIRMFLYPIIVHQYHAKKNIYRAKFPHSKNVFNEYCCIGSCRSCFPYSDNENWGMKSILFNETIK